MGFSGLFFDWENPNKLSKFTLSGLSLGAMALIIVILIAIHFCTVSLVGPTDIQRAFISAAFVVLTVLAASILACYLLDFLIKQSINLLYYI